MTARRLWILYIAFVLYGTTIPFRFTTDLSLVREHLASVTLNPLISPATGLRVSIPDEVQNVLFFLPFGVLGVLARDERRRRRVLVVALEGAALSALVETVQLFTRDRVTSTADVVSNTAGALVGGLAASSIDRVRRSALAAATRAGLTNNTAFRPFVAIAVLAAISAWEPFDVTLDVSTLVSKARALAEGVWQAGVPTDEGVALIQYALLSVAACGWLAATAHRRVRLMGALIGVAAAFGLEAGQFFITSRMPGLEDALVRAAGALAGIGIWQLCRRGFSRRAVLAVLALATALAAATQQLSPFVIAAAHRPFELMPFLSDYEHTTFEAVSHVIELLILYAPVGYLWGRWHASFARAVGSTLAVTLAIAWPIEYFQGWIVGRYPDVTDIFLSLAGAALACYVGHRSVAALPHGKATSW
jgi:glycopeptide antibiotics resistance protein